MRKRMSAGVCLSAAGLACSAATGQFADPVGVSLADAQTITPVSVQPILGVRTDGTLALGDVLVRGGKGEPARRGVSPAAVYDSYGVGGDTDGDGFNDLVCGDLCAGLSTPSSRWFFGTSFAWQAFADDAGFNASRTAANPNLSGFQLPVSFASCDNGPGSEPLSVILSIYETPDLSGYDTDGDGQVDSPYPRTDADGDGFVDQFTAGVIVTFANDDTDGDGLADILLPGVYNLLAIGLTDTDGDGVPGDISFGGFPQVDADGDGRPDGAIEVFFTRGVGPDTDGDGNGDGPIFGSFVASTLAAPFLWGTRDADSSGCAAANGIVDSRSGGICWGQGQNTCPVGSLNAGPGFSDGASDGGIVNNFWDPSIDVTDFTGTVACPDPITPAVLILGEPNVDAFGLCADTNGDGFITPADFNAWVIAFNSQLPACDQNNDGLCTPADFNAWIVNFNLGAAGPVCP